MDSIFLFLIASLFAGLLLIRELGKEDVMDFTKLTAALNNLTTAIQGLPAAIAAENTKSQAIIDAATDQVNGLAASVQAATTPAV